VYRYFDLMFAKAASRKEGEAQARLLWTTKVCFLSSVQTIKVTMASVILLQLDVSVDEQNITL